MLDEDYLRDAPPLNVHRKTDYPPMTDQLKGIYSELKTLRQKEGRQLRKGERVRKHLDALILDLWVASNYYQSPWRRISRNKSDYRKETRYRKLYFKYDLLMGVLDDLIKMDLIEQKIGFKDKQTGVSFQTRIKATDNLLGLLDFSIEQIQRNKEVPEEELIIKKDESGNLIDYVDDHWTNENRLFLTQYNERLRNTSIGTDAIALRYKYDPTSITLKQIFNGEGGGRYYGGFWQTLPKLDRLKLMLEGGEVCEVDYVAIHPTLAYAFNGIQYKGDPYLIEGCSRSEVKVAFLVLFNCKDRNQAINTIRSKGVKNAGVLIDAIEEKHWVIKAGFYNPKFGMMLQNTDAWLAEKVMKKMLDLGIACLPIHDSFICPSKHKEVLEDVMKTSFYEIFSFTPSLK